jgi:hypothetical protein
VQVRRSARIEARKERTRRVSSELTSGWTSQAFTRSIMVVRTLMDVIRSEVASNLPELVPVSFRPFVTPCSAARDQRSNARQCGPLWDSTT